VKNLLLLVLPLSLPFAVNAASASASSPMVQDPIAYSCYFCTWDEMQQAAISRGQGEHFVYDSSSRYLVGFVVEGDDGTLSATGFTPPGWMQTQFNAMINVHDAKAGAFVHRLKDVMLLAPGTHAARSDVHLWGHHTSALHPLHPQARETARRYIASKPTSFAYMKADVEHGRLLRLQSSQGATVPIVARLEMSNFNLGNVDFFYDHDSKRWEYLGAIDAREPVQESADDFVGPTGRRTYFYSMYHGRMPDYFVQRAHLAGVTVRGKTPPYNDLGIVCELEGTEKVCTLMW